MQVPSGGTRCLVSSFDYKNYISLGYFCDVAQDLEKLGLRSFSSPFDWGISSLPGVIEAIDNGFDGFMARENLSQSVNNKDHYLDDRYGFYSFHDFSKYVPLDEQYDEVREKYQRRIARFLEKIKEPTLFIRYISSEERDESGNPVELKWIEDNYQHILDVLRRSNPGNDIIFMGDESAVSDTIKIYHTALDKSRDVNRLPIINSKELYPLLSSAGLDQKQENIRRYKKNSSIPVRGSKAVLRFMKSLFRKEYTHDRTYDKKGK